MRASRLTCNEIEVLVDRLRKLADWPYVGELFRETQTATADALQELLDRREADPTYLEVTKAKGRR